ncbi:Two component system, signal transduction response regulator [Acididesulfobacillus acetoxydans]|uniref:Stage 0 sporulation protein A homolog n=1 Tax=Acididesulfobacillus acetoxydans TaxID=1561005 RepID=A0A8S0VXV7_9FIRM|nr:diguanylate cyclase [Acididesulfobacillus acetoxydans]CAA7602353.1 Two component system, signal transduction response regulator [Acididesulfobacillus acetoxydans]CEJ08412.1 Response regulator receiver modulated diguanylate cyclase with PAS/PAC sensor [Acididesulfobacillus acetoxydans]
MIDPGGKKILLLEDSRFQAKVEEKLLRNAGYEVITARTGAEGLTQIALDETIDLALIDVELEGGLDGIQVAEEILRVKDLPIVFLSACTGRSILERVHTIAYYGYVVKDSGEFVLLSSIKMALALSEAHKELKESAEKFKTMFFNHGAMMLLIQPHSGRILEANRAACQFYDYPPEKMREMTIYALSALPQVELAKYLQLAVDGKFSSFVFSHRKATGEVRNVEVFSYPMRIQSQELLYSIIFDVTEQKKMEAELRESEARLRNITMAAQEAIIMLNEQDHVIFWNPSAERLLGYSEAEMLGAHIERIIPERHRTAHNEGFARFQRTGRGNFVNRITELEAWPKEGREIIIEMSLSALPQSHGWHAVSILRDITEKRKMEEELRRMSVTDPLTRAYNRRYFVEVIKREIERKNRSGIPFSLTMFDIDHFKRINDTYGHEAGDRVLCGTVTMVQERIRKVDSLARWGGEEFMVLLADTTVQSALTVAEDLRERLSHLPFEGVGSVTASFGVAEFCLSDTSDSLLRRVDDLLYQAKKEGRNCVRHLSCEG